MEASKRFQVRHNVTFKVIDEKTGELIQEQTGHNAATNTLLEGIGLFLAGQSVLNQGSFTLDAYIPQYISLGTMGLGSQAEDSNGLPTGIMGSEDLLTTDEVERFVHYMQQRPGYGSDGYSREYNNTRPYYGLGPAFTSYSTTESYRRDDVVYYRGVAYRALSDMIVNPETGSYNIWDSTKWTPVTPQPTSWELISDVAPRVEISFRDVVPEYEAEMPKTIDIVFSAMISSAYLTEFRSKLNPGKDYLFISEAGLWSYQQYHSEGIGANGLVAGYRMVPPKMKNWYMKADDVPDEVAVDYLHEQGIENPTAAQIAAAKVTLADENRQILRQQILRVEKGQIVQVIWKIQIGNIDTGDDTNVSQVSDAVQKQLEELFRLIGQKILYAEDITVPVSRWVSSGRSDLPYMAAITVPGIDSTYFPIVTFREEDVNKNTLSSINRSTTDTVYIYAKVKPSDSIVVPVVVCYKGMQVIGS